MFKIILSFISMILIVSCSSGVSQTDFNSLKADYNQLKISHNHALSNLNQIQIEFRSMNSDLNKTTKALDELVSTYNDVINTGTIVIQSDSEAIDDLQSQLDYIKNIQDSNPELKQLGNLNSRITKLENSTRSPSMSTSTTQNDIEDKLASKVDLIDYNKFLSDYNQLVNYVNNLPKGSSSSQSQASVGNLDANLLRQIMCVSAKNSKDIELLDQGSQLRRYDPLNSAYINQWLALNGCGKILGEKTGTAEERLKLIKGISGRTFNAIWDFKNDYWWR